jgi:hypothetical protein
MRRKTTWMTNLTAETVAKQPRNAVIISRQDDFDWGVGGQE